MQTVLHEISKPIFWEKLENSIVNLFEQRVVHVKVIENPSNIQYAVCLGLLCQELYME